MFTLFFLAFLLAQLASDEPRKFLSIPEAARRLGIGTTLLYQLIAAGEIATVRVGTVPDSRRQRRLVPVEAVEAYADSRERHRSLPKRAS